MIETISTPFNGACFPNATTTYYEFPARGAMPAVKLTWYDGGLLPPRPAEMGEEKHEPERRRPLHRQQGQDAAGHLRRRTRACCPSRCTTSTPAAPPQKLPRIAHEEHEMNWVEAIKGQGRDLVAVRIRRRG